MVKEDKKKQHKEEEKEFFRTIKKYVKNKEMSCLDSMCRS